MLQQQLILQLIEYRFLDLVLGLALQAQFPFVRSDDCIAVPGGDVGIVSEAILETLEGDAVDEWRRFLCARDCSE